MGYEAHDTIVVTSWREEHIQSAHAKAVEIFGEQASPIAARVVNGYRSFFIAPDGSKEWWPESDEGDARRAAFIEWMRSQRELWCDWVAVRFGGDTDAPEVKDYSGMSQVADANSGAPEFPEAGAEAK